MTFRQLVDRIMHRASPPYDERSRKGEQLEEIRTEVGLTLDRVDKITPPKHGRFASYARVRVGH